MQYQLTWPGLGVGTVVTSVQNVLADVCSLNDPSSAASILDRLNAHIADAGVPVLQNPNHLYYGKYVNIKADIALNNILPVET